MSEHVQSNLGLNIDTDDSIEEKINNKQETHDFEIREFPVGVIVDMFTKPPQGGSEYDEPVLYIPDYQRDYVWSDKQKSEFIESLIINLPIPYLYVADNKETGRIEIIDGSQRIRTLVEFINNDFVLSNLPQIPVLNGYSLRTLPKPTRLRFFRKTIRMIELSNKITEEGRRELFRRLNSGGSILKDMEKRAGILDGSFMRFIQNLTRNDLFKELCPISQVKLKHGEEKELILRFFAYLDNYVNFNKEVNVFLSDYLSGQNNLPSSSYKPKEEEFIRMLSFINSAIPMGFRKRPADESVPRLRFEALSVGTALALRENPSLTPPTIHEMRKLLDSDAFLYHTRSDASNSKPRLKLRLELVRDFLLGKSIDKYNPIEIKNKISKLQLNLYIEDGR